MKITYRSLDEPLDLGWQNSSSGWFHTYVFGYYRVWFDDGWTYVHAHQAHTGTLGVEPVDLDANPEYRAFLVERAAASRAVGP